MVDLRPRWSPGAAKGAAVVCLALALGSAAAARAGGPRYWDWPEGRSFAEVTLAGAGFDTLGGLTAGPAVTVRTLSGPEVVWRVATDGRGGWYVGTGHGGEIHHVAADGRTRLVARLESTEVFSLVMLPGGDLLAGGGPDGRLSRVTAAGDVTEVGRIDGSYVWAMALQEKSGVVWLATGAPAAVYRYQWREGTLEKVVTLPAQNTMDLALDDRQRLLAVTQGPGLVYRVSPEAGAAPLLIGEIAQDEARRLLRGPQGAFHVLGLSNGADALASGGGEESGVAVTTSPSEAGGGKTAAPAVALYRLGLDGRGHEVLSRVWAGDRDLMTAAWSARWGWLGAGTLGTAAAETGPGGADRPASSRWRPRRIFCGGVPSDPALGCASVDRLGGGRCPGSDRRRWWPPNRRRQERGPGGGPGASGGAGPVGRGNGRPGRGREPAAGRRSGRDLGPAPLGGGRRRRNAPLVGPRRPSRATG